MKVLKEELKDEKEKIVDKGGREGDLELRRKLYLGFRGYSLSGYSNPLSPHTHSLHSLAGAALP
jgi:hypothetical protein